MDSKGTILMLTTIFLSMIIFQSAYQANAGALGLVKKVCDKTSNPGFCMKTLQSDKRTSKAKNLVGIAKIALDLAVKDSTQTKNHITGLIKSAKASSKPALKECVNQYILVAADFKSAYGEVEEGEYETANYDALVADDDAAACETALANAKVAIDSVSKRIQVTKYFSSIGDSVTSLLW